MSPRAKMVVRRMGLRKRKKADLLEELQKKGFKKMSELDAILEGRSVDEPDSKDDGAEKSDYDYLLNMNLWSLTLEKVEEIKKLRDQKIEELSELVKTTIETMWDRDLEALLKCLDEIDQVEAEEAEAAGNAAGDRRKRKATRATAAAAPPKRKPGPKRQGADGEGGATDKALLRKPLQEGVSMETVAKTTWGSSEPMQRKERPTAEGGIAVSSGASSTQAVGARFKA